MRISVTPTDPMRDPACGAPPSSPSPPPRTGHAENLLGAGLMTLSMLAIVSNDTAMKLVIRTLPLSQAIFIRGVIVTLVLLVLVQRDGGFALPPGRRDRRLLAFRTGADVAATLLYLTALQFMSIGQLSAINQAQPILIMVAAALLFRERLGARRVAAAVVGLAGVLLILRPGTTAFEPVALLAVASVLAVVARDLSSRGFSRAVRSSTVALCAAIGVTLSAPLTGGLSDWRLPAPSELAALCVAAGFLSVAYLTVVSAMRVGEVGFVSPFRYTLLVFAFLLDLAVFGIRPDGWTWAGAALVVGAGLYSIIRESRLRRARGPRDGASRERVPQGRVQEGRS